MERSALPGKLEKNSFILEATVPPNTTAIIRIPMTFANSELFENRRAITIGNGIIAQKKMKDYWEVTVNSGTYKFC